MFATNGRIGTRRRSRRDSCARGRTIRERSRFSWKASTAARASGSSNRSSRASRASFRPASTMRRGAPASSGTPEPPACPRCSARSSRSAIAPVRTIPRGARCRPARESRALLLRLAVAVLAMMQVMMFAVPTYVTVDGIEPAHRRLLEWASLTLTLPALLYCAVPFFRGAWRDLKHGRAGMDVPVALGLAAAFAGSAWATFGGGGPVYYDSVTMFIALLLVARYVELAARQRAGDAIEAVARARPATAERLPGWPSRRDVETVGAASLAIGDLVLVRPGATVAADGEIVDGRANIEEAILTGESRPRAVDAGRHGAGGERGARRRARRARPRGGRGDAACGRRAARGAGDGRATPRRAGRRSRRPVVRRRAARARRRNGDRVDRDRSATRAGGDVCRPGRIVSVRAVARDAGRAGGGRGGARAAAGRHRARRCIGDAGARDAHRVRQDRNADDGPDDGHGCLSAASADGRNRVRIRAGARRRAGCPFRASAGAGLPRSGARRRRAAARERRDDRRRQRCGRDRRRPARSARAPRIRGGAVRAAGAARAMRRPTPA